MEDSVNNAITPTLFDRPPHNGTPTSRAAADTIRPATATLRRQVLDYIVASGERGATDVEIQAALAMNPSTQRPRRIELAGAGLIRRAGRTRPSPSGRACEVWVAEGVDRA